MKITSHSELITLFVSLSNDKPDPTEKIEDPAYSLLNLTFHNNIDRANGRKLYYEIYGKPTSKPVIFLHGAISGTKLSQNIIRQLWQKDIKLICPHRAGFGNSNNNNAPNHNDNS